MNWSFEMALTALLVSFVGGAVLLILDRKYGEAIYRFGFNWTHRDPLPSNVEVGFIEGHVGLQNRLTRGFWISTLATFLFVYFGHESFLTYLLVWLIGIPSAALGIVLGGPIFGHVFDHRGEYIKKVEDTVEKVSETAEKIRSGEISLTPDLEEAKDVVKAAVAVTVAKVADVAETAKEVVVEHLPDFAKAEAKEEEPPAQSGPVEPEMSEEERRDQGLANAQVAVNEFLGKKAKTKE